MDTPYFSMPLSSPSYPEAPFRFFNREYIIIVYKTDPKKIRAAVPKPLKPDGSDTVLYEFIRMPDSPGFGDYTETGIVIPCTFEGEEMNYTSQMYLDCLPPIVGGREIWGFPKKTGHPRIFVEEDTIIGTFDYGSERVATGTMMYHYEPLCETADQIKAFNKKATKTQVNFKLIPSYDGKPAIRQLVAYNMCDPVVKQAWRSPARLHLTPHVQAPVADLPVYEIVDGLHYTMDITLPYGRLLHDYLA